MKTITVLAMLFAVGLLVACTGTQAPANPQTPTTDTTPQQTQQTPPAAQNNQPADATSAFKTALGARPGFKVTYNVQSTAQGQSVSSTMTQYFKSKDAIRTDITASGMSIESFILSGVVTTCNNAAGSWMCQQSQAQTNPEQQVESGSASYTVVPDGTMTVAGVSTTCYKVTTSQATVRYCFSSDNVPLYIKTEAPEATSELTATSYSTSVADSDFVPPQSSGSTGGYPQMPSGYNIPTK